MVDISAIKTVCYDMVSSFEHELWVMNENSSSYDMTDARYELFSTGSHLQSIIEFWVEHCNCKGLNSEASELIEFRDQCFQQIIIYYKMFSKNLSDKVL